MIRSGLRVDTVFIVGLVIIEGFGALRVELSVGIEGLIHRVLDGSLEQLAGMGALQLSLQLADFFKLELALGIVNNLLKTAFHVVRVAADLHEELSKLAHSVRELIGPDKKDRHDRDHD